MQLYSINSKVIKTQYILLMKEGKTENKNLAQF